MWTILQILAVVCDPIHLGRNPHMYILVLVKKIIVINIISRPFAVKALNIKNGSRTQHLHFGAFIGAETRLGISS